MVSVTQFPDIIRTSLLQTGVAETRLQLNQAAQEMVTGRKDNLSTTLGAQVGEYNLVTKALRDLDQSADRVALADSRLSIMGASLSNTRELVNGFAGTAIVSFNDPSAIGARQTRDQARSYVDTILTSLNATYADRRLFAGDDASGVAVQSADTLFAEIDAAIGGATDPVAISTAITDFFADGGGFDTLIYQGGDGNAGAVQTSQGAEITFDIRANDPALKNVLEGLVRFALTPGQDSVDWATDAATFVRNGVGDIIALEADIGRQQNLIDETLELADREKLILQESQERLAGVDAFEAAGEVQRLEAQLEAALTVSARLSQLSLVNFIR